MPQKSNEPKVGETVPDKEPADQAAGASAHAEAERTLLNAVARQASDGLIVVDPASGRFLVTNEKAESLFPGCDSLADMLVYAAGHCFRNDGTFYTAASWPLARSLATGERVTKEEAGFTRPDGTNGTMLVSSAIVPDASGKIIAAVFSCDDVSELKRLAEAHRESAAREQAARTEADRAISASHMKDEFLAIVSHELRTPLTPILGAVYVLKSENRQEKNYNTALDMIERNAQAQARLIEDLLDISRIVSGKFRLNISPVELSRVAEAAVEAFVLAAQAKNIELKSELAPGILVSGDPDRLRQVLSNLLANAVKFTPEKGSIAVRLRQAGAEVELQVQDTGSGIDPEFLPHVFEKYRQANSRNTRSHSGLGIGLAVVQQIVQLHSGTVDAESAGKGLGAKFTVRLPMAP